MIFTSGLLSLFGCFIYGASATDLSRVVILKGGINPLDQINDPTVIPIRNENQPTTGPKLALLKSSLRSPVILTVPPSNANNLKVPNSLADEIAYLNANPRVTTSSNKFVLYDRQQRLNRDGVLSLQNLGSLVRKKVNRQLFLKAKPGPGETPTTVEYDHQGFHHKCLIRTVGVQVHKNEGMEPGFDIDLAQRISCTHHKQQPKIISTSGNN